MESIHNLTQKINRYSGNAVNTIPATPLEFILIIKMSMQWILLANILIWAYTALRIFSLYSMATFFWALCTFYFCAYWYNIFSAILAVDFFLDYILEAKAIMLLSSTTFILHSYILTFWSLICYFVTIGKHQKTGKFISGNLVYDVAYRCLSRRSGDMWLGPKEIRR